MRKSVGELNGPWALLLKLFLATYPVISGAVLAWGAWVTQELHASDIRTTRIEEWRSLGPRFTAVDAALLKSEIKQWHAEDLEKRGLE